MFVAKIYKYALIDRFQGSAGSLDSASSFAALAPEKMLNSEAKRAHCQPDCWSIEVNSVQISRKSMISPFSFLINGWWWVTRRMCAPLCAVSLITTLPPPSRALKQKINICPTEHIKQITPSTDCQQAQIAIEIQPVWILVAANEIIIWRHTCPGAPF